MTTWFNWKHWCHWSIWKQMFSWYNWSNSKHWHSMDLNCKHWCPVDPIARSEVNIIHLQTLMSQWSNCHQCCSSDPTAYSDVKLIQYLQKRTRNTDNSSFNNVAKINKNTMGNVEVLRDLLSLDLSQESLL